MENPLISAYLGADPLGKALFLGLFFLSIYSWGLLVQKFLLLRKTKLASAKFKKKFTYSDAHPLALEPSFPHHPLLRLYQTGKKATLEQQARSYNLNPSSLHYIEAQLKASLSEEIGRLGKSLHFLSTIVSLAPFLGLLGTVWGILLTLVDLQGQSSAASSQHMIDGLSMALGTTVVGLIVAIPALIGYNMLRAQLRTQEKEMEDFSKLLLAQIELHYNPQKHV